MSAQSDRLAADFGTNIWLVDEIYQQYLADPNSVDRAWWDFFADYQPGEAPTAGRTEPPAEATADTEQANGRVAEAPEPEPAPTPPAAKAAPAGAAPNGVPLKGAAARVVQNMEASLAVPTATSVRAVAAKLLEDNRTVVNRHLARNRGGKVSFTHLIGYALVQACKAMPAMNNGFATGPDGKPMLVTPEHVNLGLAIDLQKEDGSRQLVVPSVKNAESMDFAGFWAAYEDIVRRARNNKLTADDFAGTTISLTNPGTIGTVHSVPRLMAGQGTIVGVGAMEYPAEYQGASPQTLAEMAVSKVITLTSTYDHRIIQGAQSGDFLRLVSSLLLGEEGFYEQVFYSLRIPYEPVRWVRDITTREGQVEKPARVVELIHAYRVRGHLMADVDPLNYRSRSHADLDILNHGLTLWDLDREFPTGGFAGQQTMKLREVLGVLRDSYCRTVGIEYMHIQDPVQRQWIQERVEVPHEPMDREEQLRILERLNAAEAFENFLQTKYVGHKRFSLEGGESVIPLLDAVLAEAATDGLDEVAIGMPHRGRLNVLANIVGKSYGQIFREFDGDLDRGTTQGSGDVKYHLGAEGTFKSNDGATVAVSLASNPSHLEAVDPVLEGIVRAKQDRINRGEQGYSVLPLLLHGDAAFAGQGVVAETLNLSQLSGYRTGGTVHVVVNNQLGFTTASTAARSTVYCTDVARMVQAPIFHVNGDDPEAVVRVARLAFQFRQRFRKDVVVDMVCYRRRGHSEVDEPSFTQPLMYDLIDAHRSTRKRYTEALIGRGDITVADAEEVLRNYQSHLETVFAETRDSGTRPSVEPPMEPHATGPIETTTDAETLKRVVDVQLSVPDGFTVHPRLLPQLQKRSQMLADDAIDWALAEQFAFGSLLMEGHPVRLSGQDSRRGTFGQRHAVIVDRRTGGEHTPLCNLAPGQGPFWVYDSLLSEFAALGFEYGYAVERPDALVAWEAQFGDFVDGAQSIIDEFVVSGEAKWGQHSGLVMLLPHGYEGQGPDHSSARIERFMTLCAEENMTVAAPSTPANYFHLLRAQVKRGKRRPLVVFTPKSMLRLKAATSAAADFTERDFQPVIDSGAENATRVLLTGGKVHYDLAAYRAKKGRDDVALVRVEQLYPLPTDALRATLAAYEGVTDVVWVQEEPANQGAWPFMALHLPELLGGGQTLRRVSRKAAASPASGSAKVHEVEQATLVKAAFE